VTALTIPTIPDFPAGYVATLTDMQNLSSAVNFALNKPATRIIDATAGATIGTSFALAVWTGTTFDVDGMWNSATPNRLTIQTPGFYKLRYGINTGNVSNVINTYVSSVTGPNNPNGSNVGSLAFWGAYCDNPGDYAHASAAGIWPYYLYSGDYLQIYAKAANAGSSTSTHGPGGITGAYSYFCLEYVSIT